MPSTLTLTFISYAGSAIAFLFSTLSLACGLNYLAELVEEYTVLTKKIIKGLTLAVVVLHLSLWLLDGLPFTKIMFSLACHAVYSMNLANFPYINLLSLPFIVSCALVLIDHFMWFQYFSHHYYNFMSIASFFGICVWMIPFAYFISLSANDNALPSFDKSQDNRQKKNGILKSVFGALLNRKETTPSLVETPKYAGFGNSLGGPTSSLSAGAGGVAAGAGAAPFGSRPSSFNPDAPHNFPISRPSSSNSNSSSHYGQGHAYQNSPSSNFGGSQQYASSSTNYSHSQSTVTSRF
ncbi:erv26 super protein [Mortierella alpina]|uniref:Erv26 super protein n=1 Tax=Mortierella alpina TaxID=64518 RepID=A0A9P6JDQ3_MORAP|nr:erv26 super protein [Mortierella alpina]